MKNFFAVISYQKILCIELEICPTRLRRRFTNDIQISTEYLSVNTILVCMYKYSTSTCIGTRYFFQDYPPSCHPVCDFSIALFSAL